MNNLKSIEQHWQEFAALVFRKMKPAANQRDEMKKAFFAGAFAVVCGVHEIGKPHVSEAESMKYLDDIHKEGVAFGKKILSDYAETN